MMADLEIAEMGERLAQTPHRLAAAAAGKSPAELAATPADDEWSALAILAHLRASDDILAPRLIMMLVRDEPPLPSYDERRWADVAGYAEHEYQELLAGFTFKRAELIHALRRLSPSDWQRGGTHDERGRITLLDILRHLVDHEDEHCRQIETLLASP
jgi:uncharacterized damage-inducible protein DinB